MKKLTAKRKEIIWAMMNSFEIARFECEQYEEYTEDEVRIVMDILATRLKLD